MCMIIEILRCKVISGQTLNTAFWCFGFCCVQNDIIFHCIYAFFLVSEIEPK